MASPLGGRTNGRRRRLATAGARALRVNANIATTHQEEEAATGRAPNCKGKEVRGAHAPQTLRRGKTMTLFREPKCGGNSMSATEAA